MNNKKRYKRSKVSSSDKSRNTIPVKLNVEVVTDKGKLTENYNNSNIGIKVEPTVKEIKE